MKSALRQAQEYAPLDISSYLDNEGVIAEFLTAAAEDENPDVLLSALANVAKARGMANVAQAAGLGRESLYKTLAPGARPRFQTVQAILRALNVTLSLKPTPPKLAARKLKRQVGHGFEAGVVGLVLETSTILPKKPSPTTQTPRQPTSTGQRQRLVTPSAKRKAKKAAAKRAPPAKRRA